VEEQEGDVQPNALQLAPNVPNPFNPETTISFDVGQTGHVTVSVYDIRGAHVIDLAEGVLAAGVYRVPWVGVDAAGRAVASGVYLYRLEWRGHDGQRQQLMRRMALIR
jgi:hypothetical protein